MKCLVQYPQFRKYAVNPTQSEVLKVVKSENGENIQGAGFYES